MEAGSTSSGGGGGGGRGVPVPPRRNLGHYAKVRKIGQGAFAQVWQGVNTSSGVAVAIKIFDLHKTSVETVKHESNIMRLFVHPHIARLYEVLETRSEIWLVMEHMKEGELYDHVVSQGKLNEDEARRFFQQLISGVECIHKNHVAHRDLKLENLVLDHHNNIKIIDFGFSNVMRDGQFLQQSCGSREYAAPEILSGKPYVGTQVDVWSCGVILYIMLSGEFPFSSDDPARLDMQIKRGVYRFPSHMSPGAMDLIGKILVIDPVARITIPEIRQHPWFLQNLPLGLFPIGIV